MTDTLPITPIGPFHATVRPPGSKSLTNRALLLAALSDGTSTLRYPLVADDTRVMLEALRSLGYKHTLENDGDVLRVEGEPGRFRSAGDVSKLHLGNAGTAYRFLTAACCTGEGVYELDGIERMRERPIGPLVDALRQLGAKIEYLGEDGYPPLRITADAPLTGGVLQLPHTASSQYISALLQIGPCCREGIALELPQPPVSHPYVSMTLSLMAQFGVGVEAEPGLMKIRVPAGRYTATEYDIEPDASAASYFLAAAAIVPGSRCTIEGLGSRSCQGDVGFADVLHQMGAGLVFGNDFITVMAPPYGGVLRGIDVDLNAMPDMAQTLAVVAVFARGETAIRNVGNLRIKETDRLAALKNELTKVGAGVEIEGDDLFITPPLGNEPNPATIETYDDHRMAMSFAVIGLRSPGIRIADPGCVQKTFPDYFDYLNRLKDQPAPPPPTPS